MWRWVSAAGALALLTGLLPLPAAGALDLRVAPVLVFLVAITVVAELADRVGLFEVAAGWAAHLARGRTVVLFLLLACYHRRLRGRFGPGDPVVPPDRVLVVLAGLACLGVGVAVAAGVEPAVAAGVAAVVLVAAVTLRQRRLLSTRLLPWRLVLLTAGLFVLVQAVADRGLAALLAGVAGTGDAPADLLRLAATAALASNAVTDLPAYPALEPAAAGSAARLAALLVGADAGPLVTPWASLATLLWLDRCRAAGVHVPLRQVVALGLLAAPACVLSGVAGLLLAQRPRPGLTLRPSSRRRSARTTCDRTSFGVVAACHPICAVR